MPRPAHWQGGVPPAPDDAAHPPLARRARA
jgi:hypothetical protein